MFQSAINEFLYKIIKEYSESLGLNFPPCVQQELNALAKYVYKHGVSPESLTEILQGSDSVVIDVSEDEKHVEVHLDADLVATIQRALLAPVQAPTEDSVPVVTAQGTQTFKKVSEFGGSYYLHTLKLYVGNGTEIYNTILHPKNSALTITEITEYFATQWQPWGYLGPEGENGVCATKIAGGYLFAEGICGIATGPEQYAPRFIAVNVSVSNVNVTDSVRPIG